MSYLVLLGAIFIECKLLSYLYIHSFSFFLFNFRIGYVHLVEEFAIAVFVERRRAGAVQAFSFMLLVSMALVMSARILKGAFTPVVLATLLNLKSKSQFCSCVLFQSSIDNFQFSLKQNDNDCTV